MSITTSPTRTIVTDKAGDTIDLTVQVLDTRSSTPWAPGVPTMVIPSHQVSPGMTLSLFDQVSLITQVRHLEEVNGHGHRIIECTMRDTQPEAFSPIPGGHWIWTLDAEGTVEVDAPRA